MKPLLAALGPAVISLALLGAFPVRSDPAPPRSPSAEWAPGPDTTTPGSLLLRVRLLPEGPRGAPARPGAEAGTGPTPGLRLERVTRSGPAPPRHRSRVLAPGLLLVVGFDDAGAECWRGLVKDPRPLRVEATEDPGQLSLREGCRDDAVIDIALAGDRPVRRLEIFQPVWTGAEHRPSLLGSLEVPRVP